jgi:hypothetical protein
MAEDGNSDVEKTIGKIAIAVGSGVAGGLIIRGIINGVKALDPAPRSRPKAASTTRPDPPIDDWQRPGWPPSPGWPTSPGTRPPGPSPRRSQPAGPPPAEPSRASPRPEPAKPAEASPSPKPAEASPSPKPAEASPGPKPAEPPRGAPGPEPAEPSRVRGSRGGPVFDPTRAARPVSKPKAEQEPPVVEPWMEEVARRMAEGIKARQAGRRR